MLPATEHGLSFEQTVPRSLVHKRSLENVLVTEIKACAEDRFICAGRLPRAHRFFNDSGRRPHKDILFYSELGRQCSIAISHAFLGVSVDDVFIFEGTTAALTEAVWRSPLTPSSDSVVVDVRLLETIRRRDVVSRVVGDYTIRLGGEVVCSGTGAWSVQARALFERLRRGAAKRSAQPRTGPATGDESYEARRGDTRGANVVIEPPAYGDGTGEFVTTLVVDRTHPYFFDHPCDHVPGVLLLEGCAQLTVASLAQLAPAGGAGVNIGAYEVSFAQFVECELPTTLTARVSSLPEPVPGTMPFVANIAISQESVVAGTATMHVALAS